MMTLYVNILSVDVRCVIAICKMLQQCRISFLYHVRIKIIFLYPDLLHVLSGRCEYWLECTLPASTDSD